MRSSGWRATELGMIGPDEKIYLLVEEEAPTEGPEQDDRARRPARVAPPCGSCFPTTTATAPRACRPWSARCSGWTEIMLVAPERNHSGASNSLTLFEPLRVTQLGRNRWYCSGTPTDCVHIAITGLLPEDPDMVFSGINHGPNLGDDVLYSGTVAAAMEARVLDVPAVAISVAGYPPQELSTPRGAR